MRGAARLSVRPHLKAVVTRLASHEDVAADDAHGDTRCEDVEQSRLSSATDAHERGQGARLKRVRDGVELVSHSRLGQKRKTLTLTHPSTSSSRRRVPPLTGMS